MNHLASHLYNYIYYPILITSYSCLCISTDSLGTSIDLPASSIESKGSLNMFFAPTIILETSSIEHFNTTVGDPVDQIYFVEGNSFLPGQIVYIEISDLSSPFSISLDGNVFLRSIEITANGSGNFDQMLMVRFDPSDDDPHNATITHSSNNATTKTLIVEGNPGTLPIGILHFEARAEQNSILLNWTMESDNSTSHVDVEVMKNLAIGFEKIGSMNVKTDKIAPYSFRYFLKEDGEVHYFRLKQVDINKAFIYSKVISIRQSDIDIDIKFFPNPINNSSHLSIVVEEAGKINIAISKMNGIELTQGDYDLHKGENIIHPGFISQLSPGVYMLKTKFGGKLSQVKLMKN